MVEQVREWHQATEGCQVPSRFSPTQLRQPPARGRSRVASSLYISSGVAANRLMLPGHRVINVPGETVNTLHEDIQSAQVPVAGTPISRLWDFLDPIAEHIHGVERQPGRTRLQPLGLASLVKYHTVSLLDAHTWTKSCRPIIRPNNGFWEEASYRSFSCLARKPCAGSAPVFNLQLFSTDTSRRCVLRQSSYSHLSPPPGQQAHLPPESPSPLSSSATQGQPKVQASLRWWLPSHPGPPEAQCLDEQTQGHPFFQPLTTLLRLIQSSPSEPPPRPVNMPGGFSTLTPYCPTIMSFQIHQNYFTEVDAAVNRLANLHLQASHTYLSLASILTLMMWLWRAWATSSTSWWRRSALQNQRGGCILFQVVLKPPQHEWAKLRTHGSRPGLGEEPEPGPPGAEALVLPAQTLPSVISCRTTSWYLYI
ncbi:hypothetical protein QTO34_006640 [Cnephaeus nilssonii]|uniref:Uncharacterized protein n=1 Tax=Cnephaeus nilssonii TaxID=3371016 RepID=A0AA40LIN8_CNENI|nr:hypothetical protein QTO34_006640 [Eptesicus nilssonii]